MSGSTNIIASITRSYIIISYFLDKSAVGRFFLGSISQKVLTEAHCSVEIARS